MGEGAVDGEESVGAVGTGEAVGEGVVMGLESRVAGCNGTAEGTTRYDGRHSQSKVRSSNHCVEIETESTATNKIAT